MVAVGCRWPDQKEANVSGGAADRRGDVSGKEPRLVAKTASLLQ